MTETSGRASVPAVTSPGQYEAHELRDGDQNQVHGKRCLKAVKVVNEHLAEKLTGMNVIDQEAIDRKMISLDGTSNKSKLGSNAILSVSLACASCGSKCIRRGAIPAYRRNRRKENAGTFG